MKIAVVGTGIAGLTAGWLLNQADQEVVLIERMPAVGLAAHGVDFSIDGIPLVADLPLRMFNAALWPNLYRLYQALEVDMEIVEPSKSYGEIGRDSEFHFGHTFFEFRSMKWLWRKKYRQIVREIYRMKATASSDLAAGRAEKLDFQSYLDQQGYSAAFRELFLFPALSSTVCTCSYESLRRYPAEIMLRAMLSLAMGDRLLRARHGAIDIERRLTTALSDVRCGVGLRSVEAKQQQVQLSLDSGEQITVEHLIMATQANSALQLMPEITHREREMLASFEYENVEVVLHRDERLMPPHRRDWSTFNLLTNRGHDASMCSVWLNRFYPAWATLPSVFQTIMPIQAASADKVICQRRLQRPVVNQKSLHGLKLLDDLHRESNRRVWFCGSYASGGVPLLESGVAASFAVVQHLLRQSPNKIVLTNFT